MSKSTTGAYGDFPDYYYTRGNQFSTYLRGKTLHETWDQRMEKTLVADTVPTVGPRSSIPAPAKTPRPKPSKPKAAARVLASPTLAFARSNLSSQEIRDLALTLGKDKGIDVSRQAARDPVVALSVALAELSSKEEQGLLERLRERSTISASPMKIRPPKAAKRPSAQQPRPREREKSVRAPTHCSVCSVELATDDIAFWSANRAAFFEHGYCRACGGKMLVVFGAG